MCEAEALLFLRDITRGYSALLSKKIIHRDIKPGNILLNKGVAKLGDFGYSRVITDPNTSEKLTLLGSPNYAAPEMFAGKDYCSKCDVWSLGIVLYEMLHGNRPWVAEDKPQLYQAILSQPLKFKPGLNPKIAHLLARMLVIESKQRISWD